MSTLGQYPSWRVANRICPVACSLMRRPPKSNIERLAEDYHSSDFPLRPGPGKLLSIDVGKVLGLQKFAMNPSIAQTCELDDAPVAIHVADESSLPWLEVLPETQ